MHAEVRIVHSRLAVFMRGHSVEKVAFFSGG